MAQGERQESRRWPVARLIALIALLAIVVVLGEVYGFPGVNELRDRAERAGSAGALAFLVGYAVLALVPAPKGVLTALGGALYGFWLGALLAWAGAMIGAIVAFAIGRVFGREAVDRMVHGRLATLDATLADHGLGAVVAVRLTPVLPFTAVNYVAALTRVRVRHYVVGTALGMVPGSLACAAFGAWGTSPWGIFAAAGGLVVLVVVGVLVGHGLHTANAVNGKVVDEE